MIKISWTFNFLIIMLALAGIFATILENPAPSVVLGIVFGAIALTLVPTLCNTSIALHSKRKIQRKDILVTRYTMLEEARNKRSAECETAFNRLLPQPPAP